MTAGDGQRGVPGGRPPGQPAFPPDQLRQLVREVLADVLAQSNGQQRGRNAVVLATALRPRCGGPASPGGRGDRPDGLSGASDAMWTVRIGSDDDLHAFALRVLKLADNPRLRRDLAGGRVRFRLAAAGPAAQAAGSATGAEPPASRRVDKGAVTERTVAAAAAAGVRLVLGPRAVLTPLARDKARALGVPIDKER